MRTRLLRWVLVVTLAETVGFSVPAAVGVAVTGTSLGRLAIAVVLVGSVDGGHFWAPSKPTVYTDGEYCRFGVAGWQHDSALAGADRDSWKWQKIIIEE